VSPLRLVRPIVWLDLESTGLAPDRDRIIEASLIKEFPDGRLERRTWRINPGIPIPPEATAVHHIHDRDVLDAPSFASIAAELGSWLEGADVGGFGVARFDLLLLTAEFRRAGVAFDPGGRAVVDAQIVFHTQERRDLSAASRFYLGRELVGAHQSKTDVEAARAVFEAQLERYPDLPREPRSLATSLRIEVPIWVDSEGKLRWEKGEIVVTFGRHRGRTLRDLARSQPDYLEWLIASDFAEDLKALAAAALKGEFPPPPAGMTAASEQQALDLPPC
jgi:DNA polymerase-3 subunit epsilon